MEREMTSTTDSVAVESARGDTRDWPLEVRALLAKLQRCATNTRCLRRQPRDPFFFVASVHFDDPQRKRQQATIHTRDRSRSCVAFMTQAHLELGQLVELDFTQSPATQQLGRLTGRVRRCRQFHEGWFDCVMQLGATARRSLSWWERAIRWLGEATGFGPNDRRGHGRRTRRAA